MMVKTTVPFLVAGDGFEVSLPSAPISDERSAALTYAGEERSITFQPGGGGDPKDAPYLEPLATVRSRDGFPVEIYRDVEPPHVLTVFWRLDGGLLRTFVNSGSVEEAVGLTQVVRVQRGAAPRLTFDAPAAATGNGGDPFQDIVAFSLDDAFVEVFRDPTARRRAAREITSLEPAQATFDAQRSDGFTIRVTGSRARAERSREEAREVADSLRRR